MERRGEKRKGKRIGTWNTVKRNSHSNTQLNSGQVDIGHLFGGGMLDLKTRVQFQKVKFVGLRRVKVLNSSDTDVFDSLGKTNCSAFHFQTNISGGNDGGGLLDNFLMPPLDRTISSIQTNNVVVAISNNLDLQMMTVFDHSHQENGRPRDLSLDLSVG